MSKMTNNDYELLEMAKSVRLNDSSFVESRAAALYFKTLFGIDFSRNDLCFTNSALNYGYAIVRAIVARALVGAGLIPTVGVHHHNRYDAYCLADDIMEPYRPYVDRLVIDIVNTGIPEELDVNVKRVLLELPVKEVIIDGIRRPLMLAVSQTVNSLQKCFSGSSRKVIYPSM